MARHSGASARGNPEDDQIMEIPHVQNTRHDSPLGNRERVRSKAISAHPGAERLHASKSSPMYEIDAQGAAVAFISGILVKSEKQAKTLHSWRSNRPATNGSVPVSGEAPRDTALPSIALTQMNQNPQGVRMAPPSPMLRDTEKSGHDRDRSRNRLCCRTGHNKNKLPRIQNPLRIDTLGFSPRPERKVMELVLKGFEGVSIIP